MRRNTWIAAMAAGLFSVAALAHGGPGGHGPGMGMGMGMGGAAGGGYGTCAQAGGLEALGLTTEQRSSIATIMEESATQRLALMDDMHHQRSQAVRTGNPDTAAMTTLRDKMQTLARERRDRIDAVLTPEQRDRSQRGWGPGRGFGPGR